MSQRLYNAAGQLNNIGIGVTDEVEHTMFRLATKLLDLGLHPKDAELLCIRAVTWAFTMCNLVRTLPRPFIGTRSIQRHLRGR